MSFVRAYSIARLQFMGVSTLDKPVKERNVCPEPPILLDQVGAV